MIIEGQYKYMHALLFGSNELGWKMWIDIADWLIYLFVLPVQQCLIQKIIQLLPQQDSIFTALGSPVTIFYAPLSFNYVPEFLLLFFFFRELFLDLPLYRDISRMEFYLFWPPSCALCSLLPSPSVYELWLSFCPSPDTDAFKKNCLPVLLTAFLWKFMSFICLRWDWSCLCWVNPPRTGVSGMIVFVVLPALYDATL